MKRVPDRYDYDAGELVEKLLRREKLTEDEQAYLMWLYRDDDWEENELANKVGGLILLLVCVIFAPVVLLFCFLFMRELEEE